MFEIYKILKGSDIGLVDMEYGVERYRMDFWGVRKKMSDNV